MNRNFTLALVLLLLTLLASFFLKPTSKQSYVQIGDKKIKVEIASTQEQVTQGLSNRPSLPRDQGMYFVFPERKTATFWMKDMRFPIDIIWITDEKVVGIEKNAPVPKDGVVPAFTSPTAVTNVLEVNALWSEKNNVKLNDTVKIVNN